MSSMKTETEMLDVIRQAAEFYGSQKNLAKKMNVSQSYLSDILKGKREVSENVAAFFGFGRHVYFLSTAKPESEKE